MTEQNKTKDFVIEDTKSLQLKSLREFAAQLGYFMHPSGYFCASWTQHYPCDKNIISFHTMVSLHNDGNWDNHGKVYKRMGFDLFTWEKAKGSKIVHRVSLIANKKKKTIFVNKHLVWFTRPFYEDMFLNK